MENSLKLKQFQMIKKLGDGSFSQVFLAKRSKDQSLYAIKKIKLILLSQKEQQNALNEVRLLASIKNTNIIQYKETFIDEFQQSLYIVLEYANLGDILGKIKSLKSNVQFNQFLKIIIYQNQIIEKQQTFDENEVWKCLIHTLTGLQSLHSQKICHRDIKCGNIFICQDEQSNPLYKLGDFNVSKITENDLMQTQTGTPYYCAPEIWKNQFYDCKSDMWSLGCVIYEMCCFRPPFTAQSMESLSRKICKAEYSRIDSQYSDDLWEVIQLCLKSDPKQRISSKKLLSHSIINKKILQQEQQDQLTQESIQLIQTIKMPMSLRQLQQKLPKSNYETPVMKQSENFNNNIQKTNSFHDAKILVNQKEKNILQHLSPDLQIMKIIEKDKQKNRNLSIFSVQKFAQKKEINSNKLINNDFAAINLR